MENYNIDKEKSLDNIDLGTDSDKDDLPQATGHRVLRSRRETEISEDERELQHSRRISVSWKIPDSTTPGLIESLDLLADSDISLIELQRQYETQIQRNTLLERASCSEDVIHVWTNISRYIISSLKGGKGVQIPGLLTLTYQTRKQSLVDLPEYFAFKKIPIMIMSEFVVKRYGLLNKSDQCFGSKAPSIPMDLSEIAKITKLPRSIVEGAVVEVLQTFARTLACNKPVEFPLPNIGKLQVLNKVATMKFYDQFYKSVGFTMEPALCVTQNATCQQVKPFSAWDKEKKSIPDYNATLDPNFETIPGHMTPLRKHVPTEEFRSVFHLREVRSVHEEEIDVEDKDDGDELGPKLDLPEINRLDLLNWKGWSKNVNQFGKCGDLYNDKKWNFLFPTEIQRERINIEDVGKESEEEFLGEDDFIPIKKHRCRRRHKHHHRTKKSYPEELGEIEDQIIRTTPNRPNKGIGESFGEDRLKPTATALEEVGETLLGPEESPFKNSEHVSNKSVRCLYTSETSFGKQFEMEQRMAQLLKIKKKPKPPKKLYEKNPTGNFGLDLILSNPDHYKCALYTHHINTCGKILGVDALRQHYERKAKGPSNYKPMSYENEDPSRIPLSPR